MEYENWLEGLSREAAALTIGDERAARAAALVGALQAEFVRIHGPKEGIALSKQYTKKIREVFTLDPDITKQALPARGNPGAKVQPPKNFGKKKKPPAPGAVIKAVEALFQGGGGGIVGGDKVWISDVAEELGVTVDQLAPVLQKMHTDGDLVLTRWDAMASDKSLKSQIRKEINGQSIWKHQIRKPDPKVAGLIEQAERTEDPEELDRIEREIDRIERETAKAEKQDLADLRARIRALISGGSDTGAKNREMKKLAKELGLSERAMQEFVESELVEMAAELANDKSKTTEEAYNDLVALYDIQPRFGKRDSDRVKNQAYSTPIPLAYAVAEMADAGAKGATLYEPTAGMGALTIMSDRDITQVNELNPLRLAELKKKGFKVVTNEDAKHFVPSYEFSRILANPPFGTLSEAIMYQGYPITKVEHLISVKALEAMEDGGKAALILGAGLHGGKVTKPARIFMNYLINNFNVVGNFEVSGDLYKEQGTTWPVQVVAISGRRKQSLGKALRLRQDYAPVRLGSWKEVWDKVQEVKNEGGVVGEGVGPEWARGALDDRTRKGKRPTDATKSAQPAEEDGGKAGRGSQPNRARNGKRGNKGERPGGPSVRGGKPSRPPQPEGRGDVSGQPPKPEGRDIESTGQRGAADQEPGGAQSNGGSDTGGVGGRKAVEQKSGGFLRNLSDARQARAAELKAQIRAKLGHVTIGVDPTILANGIELTTIYVEAGIRNFREYVKEMFSAFGAPAKSYLRAWWAGAQDSHELGRELEDVSKAQAEKIIAEVEAEENAPPEPSDNSVPMGRQVSDRQREYNPASKVEGLGTLVSSMLAPGLSKALTDLRRTVGDVDTFLIRELGFDDKADLAKALKAEQVDGVGLAINNIRSGRSLIIADDTGIGKGRQAAAIIGWGKRQGYLPIFITAAPKLFSDIYSDAMDIDRPIKPFLLGDEGSSHIKDKKTNRVLQEALTRAKQVASIDDYINESRDIRADYDSILTTYSQLNSFEKGGDLGGGLGFNPRHRLFHYLASKDRVLLVMDESHKAAGAESITGAFFRGGDLKLKKRVGGEKVTIGFPGMLDAPGVVGVIYLSATYAKTPDNMGLYSKTALGKAAANQETLLKAFKRGGLALQQWTSNALSESGELLRREHSFSGVEFVTRSITKTKDEVDAAIKTQDHVSRLLRDINNFSKMAVMAIREEGSRGTGDTESRLQTTEFSSILHNYVSQLLFASKIKSAVRMAVESYRNGEAVVIAVGNTMEAALQDFVESKDLKEGEVVEMDFSKVLIRALDRTMKVTDEDASGSRFPVHYSPEDLGLSKQYNDIVENILESGIDLPASPIDSIHAGLRRAGMRTGELTGRTLVIDYDKSGVGRLRKRSNKEKKDKNSVVHGMNSGGLDAVILNASGAEGLSIHASKSNPTAGQKPRHMIVVQASLDINTVKQIFGRILRTGMPGPAKDFARYTLLVSPVEADRRPFAVLSSKMSSLNANTTGDTEGSVSVSSLDVLNKYGDQVVTNMLSHDKELASLLGMESPAPAESGLIATIPNAARRATGRIAILKNEKQAEFYELLKEQYDDLVESLKQSGEYDLEIDVQEKWDAKRESTAELAPATGESTFGSGLQLHGYSIIDPRKPLKPAELRQEWMNRWGTIDPEGVNSEAKRRLAEYYIALEERETAYTGARPDPSHERYKQQLAYYEVRVQALKKNKAAVYSVLDHVIPLAGHEVSIEVHHKDMKERFRGTLLSVNLSVPSRGDNPYSPSRITTRWALADPRRVMTLTAYQLGGFEVDIYGSHRPKVIDTESFGKGYDPNVRQRRFVITGNMITAIATAVQGNITAFRTSDGGTVSGLVMPRGWTDKELSERDPRLRITTGSAAVRLLRSSRKHQVAVSGKNRLRIVDVGWGDRKEFTIEVAGSKRDGGVYYLDEGLEKILQKPWNIHSSGKHATIEVSEPQVEAVVDYLLNEKHAVVLGSNASLPSIEAANNGGKLSLGRPRSGSRFIAEHVESALPGAKVSRTERGWKASLPNGETLLVELGEGIPVNVSDVMSAYGVSRAEAERLASVGANGIAIPSGARITLSDGRSITPLSTLVLLDPTRATNKTLDHEILHAARMLGLFDTQVGKQLWGALIEEHGTEEAIAVAREGWARPDGLWSKIRHFFARLWSRIGAEVSPGYAMTETFTERFWAQRAEGRRDGFHYSLEKPARFDETSLKNAAVDELREMRAVGEISSAEAESYKIWLSDAFVAMASEGLAAPERLVATLQKVARPLEPREHALLTMYHRQLHNDYERATDSLFLARGTGNSAATADANTAVIGLEAKMGALEEVARKTGTASGRSLVARKISLRRDFTLATLNRRAKAAAGGQEISAEEQARRDAEMAEYARKIAALEGRLKHSEADKEALQKRVQELLKQTVVEEQRNKIRNPRAGRVALKKKQIDALAALKAAWEAMGHKFTAAKGGQGLKFSLPGGKQSSSQAPQETNPELLAAAKQMADVYIEQGVTSFSEFWASASVYLGADSEQAIEAFRAVWLEAMPELPAAPEIVGEDLTNPRLLTRAARRIQTREVKRRLELGVPGAEIAADRDGIVDIVQKALEAWLPTKEMAWEALSGYGQFKAPSKEEVDIVVQNMNAELLKRTQLDVLERAGLRAEELSASGATDDEILDQLNKEDLMVKATGFLRRDPTDVARQLAKQIAELKKGLPQSTKSKEGQLRTARDAAMRFLRNRIADIRQEIDQQQRTVQQKRTVEWGDDVKALRAELAALMVEHRKMFPRQGMTEAQKDTAVVRGLEKALSELEARRSRGDAEPRPPSPKRTSAQIDALRLQVQEARAVLEAMRDPEVRAMKLSMASLARRLRAWQKILDEKDFAEKPRPEPRELTSDELDMRRKLDNLKGEVFQRIADYRLAALGPAGKAGHFAMEIAHVSRTMMTSIDASAVLRQGGILAVAHPKLAKEAFAEMTKAMLPGARGERSTYNSLQRILSDKEYGQFSIMAGLSITIDGGPIERQEEAFMGRWAKKIPGLALSGRGYTTFLNNLRFSVFKLLCTEIGRGGRPTLDDARLIADYVNSATGRTSLAQFNAIAAKMNSVFFAPRYVLSRFEWLAMPLILPFKRGSREAKMAVGKEIARSYVSTALFIGSLLLFKSLVADDDDDEPIIETNPLSSDFMKLKIGETRQDMTYGLASSFVIFSRMLPYVGGTKSTKTGKVAHFDGNGPTRLGLLSRFARSKLAPIPGALATIADDWTNPVGEKETPLSLGAGLFAPLGVKEVWGITKSQRLPAGLPLAVFSLLGSGSSTYGPRTEFLASTAAGRQEILASDTKTILMSDPPLAYDDLLTPTQFSEVEAARLYNTGALVYAAVKLGVETDAKTRAKDAVRDLSPDERWRAFVAYWRKGGKKYISPALEAKVRAAIPAEKNSQ